MINYIYHSTFPDSEAPEKANMKREETTNRNISDAID